MQSALIAGTEDHRFRAEDRADLRRDAHHRQRAPHGRRNHHHNQRRRASLQRHQVQSDAALITL